MEAIKRLQEMGYIFTVVNGRLKYRYSGPDEPDVSLAAELIASLRANKEEALSYLGAIPPPLAELKPDIDTAEVIHKIYQGTFTGSALISVLPEYRDIFGYSVWICASETLAAKKRADATICDLIFTVKEFKLMIETARVARDELKALIDAKRTFNGLVMAG